MCTRPSTNLNILLLSWLSRASIFSFVSFFVFCYLTLAGVKMASTTVSWDLNCMRVCISVWITSFQINIQTICQPFTIVLLVLTMIGCAVNVHCKARLTLLINDKHLREISSQKIKASQLWQFNYSYTKESSWFNTSSNKNDKCDWRDISLDPMLGVAKFTSLNGCRSLDFSSVRCVSQSQFFHKVLSQYRFFSRLRKSRSPDLFDC